MIDKTTIALDGSPFVAYESYVDTAPIECLKFLSEIEKKRYMRYALLYSMFHIHSDNLRTDNSPVAGDKEKLDSSREYGEAALIPTLIRDAVISGEIILADYIDDAIWKVFDDSGLDLLILNNELNAGLFGDSWFHLYAIRPGEWRVEILDPRQVVIQVYNREILDVVIWKLLPKRNKDDKATRVWTLRYFLDSNDVNPKCFWQEDEWEIDEEKARNNKSSIPFNFGILKNRIDLLAAKGLQPVGAGPSFETMTDAIYPFQLNKQQSDFIPLVHIPNVDSGRIYGLADIHKSLHTIMDLGPINKRMMTGTKLLALPATGVDSPKGQFADMKGGVDTKGQSKVVTKKLEPGMILRGKVYMVDTSKIFDALLASKDHLYQTLFAVSQTPEIAFGPSDIKVTSGTALRIVLQPLITLATNKRLGRTRKYKELIKLIGKAIGVEVSFDRSTLSPITFGDLTGWIEKRTADILLSYTSKVINVEETRKHLQKDGTLDEVLLDPEFAQEKTGLNEPDLIDDLADEEVEEEQSTDEGETA